MDDDWLARIPASPGVYLMKDKKGRVIYVGKANDLSARVRSYFRSGGDERVFVATGLLGRLLGDVETVVVNNEKEALLLENNLIKQHQPRFNVKLTDDKNYLVLRIDPKSRYPRIEVVRRIASDNVEYFGPYHSATSCRETLRMVNRHFQLRTCTDHVLNNRSRPCIQYQIKRCPAPCVIDVGEAAYGEQVRDVILFLRGKKDKLVPRLRERMAEKAKALDYENAAMVRDQISAVQKSLTRQTVISADMIDQDVIGYYRQGDQVEIAVLFMRQGKLLGRRTFRFRGQETPDAEVVRHFVRQYYELGSFVPDEVLLPLPIEDATALASWLCGLRGGRKSQLLFPMRGPRHKLLALAQKNAAASFVSRKSRASDVMLVLSKLQKRLQLAQLPRKIECFDIAHIQGTETVASMVVFVDGEPDKSKYRRFRVQRALNDDFGAMYEVLSRRLRRAYQSDPGWESPELLVIDGGKGQLSSALAARRDVIGADKRARPRALEFDIVALAKESTDTNDKKRPDRVFIKNIKDPIKLRPSSSELYLLARVRDEAHRFANTFHRQLRKKRTLQSTLDGVPGVGPKRRKQLLKTFGSVKKVKEASVDELAASPGMNRKTAKAIVAFFAGR